MTAKTGGALMPSLQRPYSGMVELPGVTVALVAVEAGGPDGGDMLGHELGLGRGVAIQAGVWFEG